MKGKPLLFREEQYFCHGYLMNIFLGIAVVWLVAAIIVLAIKDGGTSSEDSGTMEVLLGPLLLIAILSSINFFSGLVTEVRRDGLFVRFIPFHFKFHRIPLDDAETIEAKTYRPVLDYGGWGIRVGFKKKAYNVYGSRGVEIRFGNGRKLLIGSQRPEELEKQIKAIHPV